MKKLKLDHIAAQMVLKNNLRLTWRLFDDKDLSVNDAVELIDKVDPLKTSSWQVLGVAIITKILERRLRDVLDSTYPVEGDDKGDLRKNIISSYEKYYGRDINLDEVIKIIHFDFNEHRYGQKLQEDTPSRSFAKELKLYADGGSRGNPGPSASGYVIMDMEDRVIVDKGLYLGITTNNQAEYQALKLGLEEAHKMGATRINVFMDSLLVINQMKGIFKVKNRDLWPIHNQVKGLLLLYDHVSLVHVPRELNKLADGAVNRTLDEVLSTIPEKLS